MTPALLLCAAALLGAPGASKPVALRPGAIGAVRVVAADATSYSVEIVFPLEEVDGFGVEDVYGKWTYEMKVPVRSPGKVTLFDGKGPLGTVAVGAPTIVFWCENDGGVHFRPEWAGKIRRSELARALAPATATSGFAAFARVAGTSAAIRPPPAEEGLTVALHGDVDRDGKDDAQLLTQRSEAGCGGGDEPEDEVWVGLRSARGEAPLRCCGP